MKIQILSKDNYETAGETWKLLESKTTNLSLTNTWEWVDTWLTHYGHLVDYWFIVGMNNNSPCGIALVTKETHRPLPFPVKAYHIGTNGEPFQDRIRMTGNTILATESSKKAFTAALIETLLTKFSVEELVFDDFETNDAAMLEKMLKKQSQRVALEEETTLFLDLETVRKSTGDVISAFGSNMRRSVRRSMKVFDDLTIEWAETEKEALDILEELIQLYQNNQEKLGRAGMFRSQPFTNFQRDIIKKLINKKQVILFRVKSRKYGTVGCLYMFVDNNIAYSYQIGLNDFSDVTFEDISSNRLKTSYIVHALCMQECLNRGLSAYNFLIGVYRYKTEMTNAQTSVVSLAVKKSFKPHLRDSIMNVYAKLDERRNSPQALRFVRNLIKKR